MMNILLPTTDEIERALQEDIGKQDLTANLLPVDRRARANIISREAAIFCGRAWCDALFSYLDASTQTAWKVSDGERIEVNQVLCQIDGKARALLSGERVALNFLQTLSATATLTRQYVDAVAGTYAKIYDTRKTLPGLRRAQKYAVTMGGGHNQRMGLFDGVLLKENHIPSLGGITKAVQLALQQYGVDKVQVEVESLDELEMALHAGAFNVLVDNFSLADLQEAVHRKRALNPQALLEASGNINLDTVYAVAMTGVDRISIGALTKNIRAIDLSMRLVLH
ncbi:MAG: carboxylating nicotinate-nucleotide diphosphorylase [Methylophilaceae bacterium]|nr:carboxylating nicotinate-nucleotide diphosphorylase [Methylophilaceae bacterium]